MAALVALGERRAAEGPGDGRGFCQVLFIRLSAPRKGPNSYFFTRSYSSTRTRRFPFAGSASIRAPGPSSGLELGAISLIRFLARLPFRVRVQYAFAHSSCQCRLQLNTEETVAKAAGSYMFDSGCLETEAEDYALGSVHAVRSVLQRLPSVSERLYRRPVSMETSVSMETDGPGTESRSHGVAERRPSRSGSILQRLCLTKAPFRISAVPPPSLTAAVARRVSIASGPERAWILTDAYEMGGPGSTKWSGEPMI
jgi:hypothetical protein